MRGAQCVVNAQVEINRANFAANYHEWDGVLCGPDGKPANPLLEWHNAKERDAYIVERLKEAQKDINEAISEYSAQGELDV